MSGRHIGCVDTDKISLLKHIIHKHICHMVLSFLFRRHAVNVVIDHLHIEATRAPGYNLTDTTRAEQPKHGAMYVFATKEQRSPALKFACSQVSLGFGNTASRCHQEGKR